MRLWHYYAILLGAAFWVFGAAQGIIALGRQFDWEPLQHHGPMVIPWIITVALYGGLVAAGTYYLLERKEADRANPPASPREIVEVLIDQLRIMLSRGDYQKVVRYGAALSRPLWLEGKYEERIEVGKIVAQAAPMVPNPDSKALASALIDDTGWSYAAQGSYEEAEEDIDRGLQHALKEPPNYYLVAKGLRHKGGIALERKEYTLAFNRLQDALEAAGRIEEKLLREEMTAGIEHGLSIACLKTKKYAAVEEYCGKARTRHEALGDRERAVKTYSVLGRSYEERHLLSRAKNAFEEGLNEAKQIGRHDEIARNHHGLGRVFMAKGKYKEARCHLEAALALSAGQRIFFEDRSVSVDLKELEKKEEA